MTELGNNSRFAVIGYGSWATTIVGKLTQNGRHVNWHVRNPEVIEGVLTDGYNPKYVSDMELERSLLFISQDINEIVAASDIVILCVPSAYLKKTMEDLNPALLKGKFVISAVKGIIPDDYTTVLEFVHDKFGLPFKNLGLISGPSHAEEVSRGKLSYLTIACNTIEDAEVIALAIRSDTLRISTSTDIYGIEYAAIMKNIYAIASGMSVGLGYGDNFLAVPSLRQNCAIFLTAATHTRGTQARLLISGIFLSPATLHSAATANSALSSAGDVMSRAPSTK